MEIISAETYKDWGRNSANYMFCEPIVVEYYKDSPRRIGCVFACTQRPWRQPMCVTTTYTRACSGLYSCLLSNTYHLIQLIAVNLNNDDNASNYESQSEAVCRVN